MNAYLEEFQKHNLHELPWQARDMVDGFGARYELTRKYSWAIPSTEALECLAKYSPLVEIGAGTGYWASLLEDMGVEIHAYDESPPPTNDFHSGAEVFTNVRQGTPDVLRNYPTEWNLFLCWPPMSDMAMYALGYHRGKYICYVGEHDQGCNADKWFFRLLRRLYEPVEEAHIPQWWGLHDYFTVYKRKGVE